MVADAIVSWNSQGWLGVQVKAPEVVFTLGDGASNARSVTSAGLSANRSYFAMDLVARAGAHLHVADVIRITNTGAASKNISLNGESIANPNYQRFEWTIRENGTVVSAIDLTMLTPRADLTLPAAATFIIAFDVVLAEGAGMDNAQETFNMWIEVD